MSAIVAAAGRLSPEDKRWVERATAFCRPFAPDGDGVHADERCALGHALLRTSPADTAGPVTLDGRVWLAADARLDDRAGLRARLGGRAPDGGDAALVLAAYSAWGERCLDHLQGDFAFALWDAPRGRLLCARDQMGIAQLHWARAGETLLVATALDALHLHPAVGDALDEDALADFVVMRAFADPEATAFAGIRRVPPAHALTEDGVRRYWRLPRPGPLLRLGSAEAYAERYVAALDAAVADRITGDRTTTHVSGGLDSTSIAVSARRIVPEPAALRGLAYTLGANSGDEEGALAAGVAAHAGFPIDVLVAGDFPSLDPLAEPLVRTPEPTSYLPTGLSLEIALRSARHGPVALSGDGGDALLGFDPAYWLRWLRAGRVVRTAFAFAGQVAATGGRPRPWVREIVRRAAYRRALRRQAALPEWLRPRSVRQRVDVAPGPSSLVESPVWRTTFAWGDPAFTGLPVRHRYPFFDLRLVAFVRSLPPDPWLVGKRVAREANRTRLPEAVRSRPKTPLVRIEPPPAPPGLDELIRSVPDLGGVLNLDRLAAAARDADLFRLSTGDLAPALGLVHWRAHWRRPG